MYKVRHAGRVTLPSLEARGARRVERTSYVVPSTPYRVLLEILGHWRSRPARPRTPAPPHPAYSLFRIASGVTACRYTPIVVK